MSERPDAAQLAEAIKGLSDEDLKVELEKWGVDTVLKDIFAGMQDAFRPDKAGSNAALIQYDVDVDGDIRSWTVDIANGACKTSEGAAENPRLTLQLGLINFVRLIFRQADGTALFMSGKLKLKGDMMFAMQMQNYFESPA